MSEAFEAALSEYDRATEKVDYRTARIRALKEARAEADLLGDGPLKSALQGLVDAEIQAAGRPSPFWDRPSTAVPALPGCYEAPFGRVHMKPSCRCGVRGNR